MDKNKKKEKPKYTRRSNTKYCLGLIWEYRKSLIFCSLLLIPLDVALSVIWRYYASLPVALITEGKPLKFFAVIAAVWAIIYLMRQVFLFVNMKIERGEFYLNQAILEMLNRKIMRVSYEYLESKEGQDKRQISMQGVTTDSVVWCHCNVSGYFDNYKSLLSCIVGLFTMSIIVSFVNPLILLVLAASTLIPYYTDKIVTKKEHDHLDEWSVYSRKMNYIGRSMSDWSKIKDIKICGLRDLLNELFHDVVNDMVKWRSKWQWRYFFANDLATAVFTALLKLVAYAVLLGNVVAGKNTAAEFVFYFGIITGYSSWLRSFMSCLSDFNSGDMSIGDLRTFMEASEGMNGSEELPNTDTYSVEFDHVSFKYQGAEEYTLKDISFKIENGEKLALVGRNGAGKTTIVKLMCGLISPTEGTVRIGGKDIRTLKANELFSVISAVFQDIHMLPVSVRENITFSDSENTDNEKLQKVIALSGLEERISKMVDGIETPLCKSVKDGADELSGGEKQKLALARALYKDGKIMILDEPTAALDPIAENTMYLIYNELTQGRTSLYISHRLSSTRFCDRILLIENGEIKESGSHDTLMAQGGSYAELFSVQAQYYSEGGDTIEE